MTTKKWVELGAAACGFYLAGDKFITAATSAWKEWGGNARLDKVKSFLSAAGTQVLAAGEQALATIKTGLEKVFKK